MELTTSKRIAVDLLDKHDLLSKGWCFEFDNSKRRLGCCKYGVKTISVSKNYHQLLNNDEFTDVILHEIAHALVGHGHGHNLVWKMKATEIGCNGERLYRGDKKVEGRYSANCPQCDTVYYRHRIGSSARKQSCGKCSGGSFNPKFLLRFVETI